MAVAGKTRLVAAALVLAWGLTAQAGQTSPGASLAELLELGRTANPEFAAMRQEVSAARERTEMAGALMDPKLRLERMTAIELMPEARLARMNRVQLMQDLPWFGKRELKSDIARFGADTAAAQANAAWNELAARIKATYAELEFVGRNERVVRQVLDLMVGLERIALARYTGGLAPQQDVIRAQVEQTAMKSELLMIERERRMLQARMNMLLGREANAPLADPQQARPLPALARLDAAVLAERARSNNPQIFAEDARVRTAQSSRDLALRNRYPDFSVGVRSSELAIGKWEWMVEINLPLQQSSRRAGERETEAMLGAALARREASANQILAELAENLAGFDWAQRSEALTVNSLLPQAEMSLDSALAGYENGRVDFATLLDAQRQVRQARQRQLRSRADAQLRFAEIERLVGEDLQ
jgi:cobalt-zinc-cadmium efflux system outer membrane protein